LKVKEKKADSLQKIKFEAFAIPKNFKVLANSEL
jgi:Copine